MAALVIRKVEGDFENVLVRVETTRVAAHVQIPVNGNSRRVVVALPAGQFHLALIAGESMVHAHAGLRRVVENPIDAATRIAPRWRLKG